MELKNKIKREINQINNKIIKWRRELHQYPELGYQEYRTAKYIAELLKGWGYQVKEGIAGTGVTALLNNKENFTIGLRFDMDALPLTEANDLPYKSRNDGVMHACGHDGHMAIGLGVACILSKLKGNIKGKLKFIFQPAEEGGGGAKKLIEQGVLEDPLVNAVLGLHIWPELEAGQVGIKKGPIMAAADRFDLIIKGVGSHSALPHLAIDPIIISAEVINGLQTIISREIDPLESAVITIGSIQGGTTFNVIPSEVVISGTIRTVNKRVRDNILERIDQKVNSIVTGSKGSCQLRFKKCFSITQNDPGLVKIFIDTIKKMGSDQSLVRLSDPSMTSEDFSEYQQIIPGLYFFLGTKNTSKGIIHSIHNACYNIDEAILPLGVEIISNLVFNVLTDSV